MDLNRIASLGCREDGVVGQMVLALRKFAFGLIWVGQARNLDAVGLGYFLRLVADRVKGLLHFD